MTSQKIIKAARAGLMLFQEQGSITFEVLFRLFLIYLSGFFQCLEFYVGF